MHLDAINENSLIPSRSDTFSDNSCPRTMSVYRDFDIGIREARLVAGVHVPGLVDVSTELVGVVIYATHITKQLELLFMLLFYFCRLDKGVVLAVSCGQSHPSLFSSSFFP